MNNVHGVWHHVALVAAAVLSAQNLTHSELWAVVAKSQSKPSAVCAQHILTTGLGRRKNNILCENIHGTKRIK